jgi:hypothetical protein
VKLLDPSRQDALRIRTSWKRPLLVATLVVLPLGLLTWPWGFLPLRWQYSRVREADIVIREVERFRGSSGRLPTSEELWARLPALMLTDDYGYAPADGRYYLSAVHSFDWTIVYDSATGRWSRVP